MTHLRGRLHITMRDLRSALSFMLIGNRDCDEIHALYASGKREEIAEATTSTAGWVAARRRPIDCSRSWRRWMSDGRGSAL